MIDSSSIREKYASMSDDELILFAAEEGDQINPHGFLLLKEIFIIRQLDIGLLEGIGKNTIPVNAASAEFTGEHWFYAFNLKEENKSDPEILAGLTEAGMDEAKALNIISGILPGARHLLKNAESQKLMGGFIFISGISITFLPLNFTTQRIIYILAWCAILFGAWNFIKGLYFKSKYKKIIQNIDAEKTI